MDKVKCLLISIYRYIINNDPIKKIWYIILLILSSIYVYFNFEEITKFTFFNEFNGRNLIFLLWLLLLLLPLFDSFEGFGVKINQRKALQNQKSEDTFNNLSTKSENIKTAEQLEDEAEQFNEKDDSNDK